MWHHELPDSVTSSFHVLWGNSEFDRNRTRISSDSPAGRICPAPEISWREGRATTSKTKELKVFNIQRSLISAVGYDFYWFLALLLHRLWRFPLPCQVLVTVTCMQSLVISLFQKRDLLKSDEASLCNVTCHELNFLIFRMVSDGLLNPPCVTEACLLCFEVLPLSLLTYHAWKPRGSGDWYDADCGWGYGNVDVGRLAGEGKRMANAWQTVKRSNPLVIQSFGYKIAEQWCNVQTCTDQVAAVWNYCEVSFCAWFHVSSIKRLPSTHEAL